MLFRIIPKELIARTNEQELTIYLKCGSIIVLKGADNPQRLRGAGPFGVVLDEFAEMRIETWEEIIQPIIRANGGWAWFVGTPKGKNHLYKFYQRGQKGGDEWKSYLLKASISGVIPADQLRISKKETPQALYNQEWECDFLEGEGAVFRGVRQIVTATPSKPLDKHLYVMGVDLAKHQDYTVISVFDRETNAQVYQDRFKTIEWPFQKKKIRAISEHYNNALVVLDATGLGDPIADDLLRAGVAVEPFKITSQSKKEIIEKLSIWIEQRKVRILNTGETIEEYDNFSYELSITGHVRYGAAVGFHDDIVIAHALAVSSLNPIFKEKPVKKKTKIQLEKERRIRKYEQEQEWEEWSHF
jgi:hypothetical protein